MVTVTVTDAATLRVRLQLQLGLQLRLVKGRTRYGCWYSSCNGSAELYDIAVKFNVFRRDTSMGLLQLRMESA